MIVALAVSSVVVGDVVEKAAFFLEFLQSFGVTDYLQGESAAAFVGRHGGVDATAVYLKSC